ncbi:MAG: hypothetical protein KGR98_03815 [Verrucomicrobia bacterium]|nr:hypothetical protein [Verrucomicrobiota bacterium]MDE3100429.1 hypothetical protein [Verrucomicrobiota bacterium]
MKAQKWALFFVTLALFTGGALLLARFKTHPRLGQPGVKAAPIPGRMAMKLFLPAKALDYTSTNVPEPKVVLGYLPHDSSYVERMYVSPDDPAPVQATIVMMGADRTSIHNANYCLAGLGLDPYEKSVVNVPIAGPAPYSLPVSRWNVRGTFQQPDGSRIEAHGVYVFWFVAAGDETPSHFEMLKRLALHQLRTGIKERWAYVSYYSPCLAHREDAAFDRMEKLIAASVPQFQLPPAATAVAQR